jgi:hypothetical protein
MPAARDRLWPIVVQSEPATRVILRAKTLEILIGDTHSVTVILPSLSGGVLVAVLFGSAERESFRYVTDLGEMRCWRDQIFVDV